MNKNEHFLSIPEVFHYFPGNNETDLNVYMVGYHDFHFLESENFERQQYCHTIHYVISGKGNLNINGKTYTVKANQLFYLNNKCTFSYTADKNDPWEYVFFEVGGANLPKYAKALNLIKEPVKTCQSLQPVLYMIKEIFANQVKPSSYLVRSLLFMLLDSINENEKNHHYSQGERVIKEAKELIDLRFSDASLDLEFICKAVHVSHSHFCRIFKQTEGITPIQYINKVKMSHAKELLKQSNMSVYEIAFKVGYREYEHFLRLFKSMNKVTPTEYRKKHKSDKKVI